MSRNGPAAVVAPHLRVTLEVQSDGIRVGWRLSGVRFGAGEMLACLALSIAGGPTIVLPGDALTVSDDSGPLGVVARDQEDRDGVSQRGWFTQRDSVGVVTV